MHVVGMIQKQKEMSKIMKFLVLLPVLQLWGGVESECQWVCVRKESVRITFKSYNFLVFNMWIKRLKVSTTIFVMA